MAIGQTLFLIRTYKHLPRESTGELLQERFSLSKPQQEAWQKGYYSCLEKKNVPGLSAAATIHAVVEASAHIAEHNCPASGDPRGFYRWAIPRCAHLHWQPVLLNLGQFRLSLNLPHLTVNSLLDTDQHRTTAGGDLCRGILHLIVDLVL